MAPPEPPLWPVTSTVLGNQGGEGTTDTLPATYHYYDATGKHAVGDPAEDTLAFLQRELSLGSLTGMLRHLWFTGANRPAMPLHYHLAVGREIVVVDRMDLHLLWTNEGRLFVKPVSRFLLNPAFCQINLQCPSACSCDNLAATCRTAPRKVALGFLYTYACLISSESDFYIANEKRLLPCNGDNKPIRWEDWKILARELIQMLERDSSTMHPRFLRAELRLSRINTIHRFTHLPRFDPYFRSRHNYSGLFGDNLAWMATATVFVVLVLTAMQVGLATERLKGDDAFQQASYGFTVFAILAPMCAFGSVVLVALLHLIKDLPLLLSGQRTRRERRHTMSNATLGGVA
ncbi:hypothetical protein K458DRAFT_434780 [Lentithecium fluviatile CBS 122367]|uniref:Subtilisin-like serine protease n=1 Tax=Lentithecium fluviatile CBS 122367 TaxID=1168545 RepID=A0A6G1IP62_9PLEO|nr:hypothetical protein K458DRAFT_434780 [Lentithecium fluviatile CBS 122367]